MNSGLSASIRSIAFATRSSRVPRRLASPMVRLLAPERTINPRLSQLGVDLGVTDIPWFEIDFGF